MDHPEPPTVRTGKKVAMVDFGPAGLCGRATEQGGALGDGV